MQRSHLDIHLLFLLPDPGEEEIVPGCDVVWSLK